MTYDKNRQVPEWVRIEIQYDECAGLYHYDDECITDEFRRKVRDEQAWWVGIIVHDDATEESESLWGIDTEEMVPTYDSKGDDLDPHGWEVVQDLIKDLTRGRQDRLRRQSEVLRKRAADLLMEASNMDNEANQPKVEVLS